MAPAESLIALALFYSCLLLFVFLFCAPIVSPPPRPHSLAFVLLHFPKPPAVFNYCTPSWLLFIERLDSQEKYREG